MTSSKPERVPRSPSNDELLIALRAIRGEQPTPGGAKILAELRSENAWRLSDARLRKLMLNSGFDMHMSVPNAKPAKAAKDLPPIELPKGALAAQQKYGDESSRRFRRSTDVATTIMASHLILTWQL